MCEHCDQETEGLRPVVDELMKFVRDAVAADDSRTRTQQVIATANTIITMHMEDNGHLTAEAVHSMAIEYATVVLRLLALEDMSGLSLGT